MVKRICYKCNAVFDRKSNYDFHINRKFDCSQNKNENNDLTDINDEKNDEKKICRNLPELAKNLPKLAIICRNQQINTKNTKNSANRNPNTEISNLSNLSNSTDFDETNNSLNINNNIYDVNIVDDISELSCYYCKKIFSSKYTLERHLKSNCKAKKENEAEKEKIFKLLLEKDKQYKEEIEELKKHNSKEVNELIKHNSKEVNELKKQNKLLMDRIDKLINMNTKTKSKSKQSNTLNNTIMNLNSNNTSNTQNNVVMVNFGKEDLSIIDEKQFIDRIVKQNKITGVKIPDEVLKIIHFNPQYPQLSNIYISDINREKCMVYEDGEWKLSNVNNIPQIMDKVCVFSSEQISNLRTKHPNNKPLEERLNTIEKYNNMIDGDYVEDLRDEGKQVEIARCEEFQAHAYNTLKKTLYNEGKKLKKNKVK